MTSDMCLEIRSLNPAIPRHRRQIEEFLQACGLRYDDMDYYAVVADESSDEIIAGGGLRRGVMKCVAVASGHKGESVANTVVSHLISHASGEGYTCVKLFTRPQNRSLFESLSFHLLAESPEAILMETGVGGIEKVKAELRAKRDEAEAANRTTSAVAYGDTDAPHATGTAPVGAIVMNCNPFTLGHRWLIEQSSKQVRRLYVVVVVEDCSLFSYEERKAMVGRGTSDLENVVVIDGSDYAVSSTTFPTYFLKRLDDAADVQMRLDLDLYRRHIAPALGAAVRFVGTEPADPLTRRYNDLMRQMLPDVREIPRTEVGGAAVSASRVRRAIAENSLAAAARLVPPSSMPYIIARLATQALQAELDTTPKPGLVDRRDSGAHSDMDYALMQRSLRTLHPYFVRLALLGMASAQPCHDSVVQTGVEAERAMLAATGGVNTHRGALFSMGLAVIAASALWCGAESVRKPPSWRDVADGIAALAGRFTYAVGTHGSEVRRKTGLKGALDNARDGYPQLFARWLPFYAECRAANDSHALHKTLLRIMCDLDDTNIAYRAGVATMHGVKAEARRLLDDFSVAGLEAMNASFKARNISPGGSADMLSLVVFLDAVMRKQ